MEQWCGKVAVVTGASSGIGAEITCQLAMAGLICIGLARRTNLVDDLNKKLPNCKGKIYSHYCDVTDLDSIKKAFERIDKSFGRVDILVNAAGILRYDSILHNQTHPRSDFELSNVINTNLMGSLFTIRAAYKIMQRNCNFGHIIQINEELGHYITDNPLYLPCLNTYAMSKYGLTAMVEVIRLELNNVKNAKVKITDISPGRVKTNLLRASGYPCTDEFFQIEKYLQPIDVAKSVLFVLGTPRNVMIQQLDLQALPSK